MSKLRRFVLSQGGKRPSRAPNYSPVSWSRYFDKQEYVAVEDSSFMTYTLGSEGPVLLLIHGGGYSALTWALFAEQIVEKVKCQVLAIDLRGHGSTRTDNEENLTLQVLADDTSNLVNELYGEDSPPIIIVGHSLGGAVAVAVAPYIPSVVGLCVIDIVEGTAIDSLSSMQSILRKRPSGFKNIEDAVRWCFNSGQTNNIDAARVSMPGQIKSILTGNVAADEDFTIERSNSPEEKRLYTPLSNFHNLEEFVEEVSKPTCNPSTSASTSNTPPQTNLESNFKISEDPTSASISKPPTSISKPPAQINQETSFKLPEDHNLYTWRINLSKTEPYWSGWFTNLSQSFLNVRVPKLLLLANIHALDTILTVGQMQGKFQFQVLPRSGHAIHEDLPHSVAEIIAAFLVKQRLTAAKTGFNPIMPTC